MIKYIYTFVEDTAPDWLCDGVWFSDSNPEQIRQDIFNNNGHTVIDIEEASE